MKTELVIKESCKQRFEPVVQRISRLLEESEETILVAIDGNAASGKTTLGYYLKQIFSCNLYHMDDFFLRDEQKTPERLQEVGGNVDYERFKEEVLEPILRKEEVRYRPFSCKTGSIQEEQNIPFQRLHIVEGSYSQHPYFEDVYHLKIFLHISEGIQKERIRMRNGEEMLERFVNEWIPKENAYFEKFQIQKQSLVL